MFPNRFYFVDDTRGISAGFHLIEGFFRDDQPLCNSVLSEEEKRHLDRLWDELYFSTKIHDKMLHGFVFFEREERGFLKHPDFNSIREEDPALGKEENLLRFEQIYLKRSNVTATGARPGKAPDSCILRRHPPGAETPGRATEAGRAGLHPELAGLRPAAYRRPLTAEETKQLAGVLPVGRQARGIRHRAGSAGEHHPHPGFAAFLLSRGIAAGGQNHPAGLPI